MAVRRPNRGRHRRRLEGSARFGCEGAGDAPQASVECTSAAPPAVPRRTERGGPGCGAGAVRARASADRRHRQEPTQGGRAAGGCESLRISRAPPQSCPSTKPPQLSSLPAHDLATPPVHNVSSGVSSTGAARDELTSRLRLLPCFTACVLARPRPTPLIPRPSAPRAGCSPVQTLPPCAHTPFCPLSPTLNSNALAALLPFHQNSNSPTQPATASPTLLSPPLSRPARRATPHLA